VWGSQPVVGVSADYSSNPALLNAPDTGEEHGALLLDAPTSYVGDRSKFSISPSFRFSNAQGYSSLDSDYEHLKVSEELDTDRSVFTATGGAARDSSLYHDYILNGSSGVERNSILADLNWDRKLTERLDLDGDLNATRVRYAAGVGVATLSDYRYASFAPSLAWNESELLKWSVSGSVGRYNSLDGLTESTSASLQLGFVKQLSELWSVAGSGGYSRAKNQENTEEEEIVFTQNGPELVIIPIHLASTQTGTVFLATVTRQATLLNLSATASRQLTPSGFAFLSRQVSYGLAASYPLSPRWSLSGNVSQVTYQQPQFGSAPDDVRVRSLGLSALWQWTEHWTITMNASAVFEHYGSPAVMVDSSGVSIEIARHFDWKQFR
jgi:hypothetical protein